MYESDDAGYYQPEMAEDTEKVGELPPGMVGSVHGDVDRFVICVLLYVTEVSNDDDEDGDSWEG